MVVVNLYDNETLYVDGYLKELLDSFKHAIKKGNTSVVMLIDGRSGMGKTTLSNQIATYFDANYRFGNQIYWNPQKFLEEGLATAKDGTCVVFDEAMIFSNRSSMTQINRMLIQALSMIRSKRICVIFNVNSIFDLDKNIVLSRADCLLHCYGDNLLDRGNFAAFFKPKGGDDRLKTLYLLGKKYYSYSKPKGNFYGRFVPKFILNEDEYTKKKNEGVNDFLRSLEKKSYNKHAEVERKLIEYIKHQNQLSMDEIADICGLNRASVYRRVQKEPVLG